jgi:hypothetical protein
MPDEYRCTVRGDVHDDLPDVGADSPCHYLTAPVDQRPTRSQLTSELDNFRRTIMPTLSRTFESERLYCIASDYA